MGERVIVSGGDMLRVYAGVTNQPERIVPLAGAGALCAGRGCVYAACQPGDTIWKLDWPALTPSGLFAGGPGVCRLLLSKDDTRLYALCRDADSLLMLDARTGMPLMLCRVGAAPNSMQMDDTGETIAVAGGACQEVVLLNADTLLEEGRMPAKGRAVDTAIAGRSVYALGMTDSMDTVLTEKSPAGVKQRFLPGMPGAMAALPGCMAVSVQHKLYRVSHQGLQVQRLLSSPGRAGRLTPFGQGLLMQDACSREMHAWDNRRWFPLDGEGEDAAVLPE